MEMIIMYKYSKKSHNLDREFMREMIPWRPMFI